MSTGLFIALQAFNVPKEIISGYVMKLYHFFPREYVVNFTSIIAGINFLHVRWRIYHL